MFYRLQVQDQMSAGLGLWGLSGLSPRPVDIRLVSLFSQGLPSMHVCVLICKSMAVMANL